MAFDFRKFDPAEVSARSSTVPVGWYTARIVDHVSNPTRASTEAHPASYLALTFEITGVHENAKGESGPLYAGRRVKEYLNLEHPRPETVEIAERDLAKIMNAARITKLAMGADSLVGASLLIRLTVEPGNAEFPEERNAISGYREAAGNGQTAMFSVPVPAVVEGLPSKPAPHLVEPPF